MKLDVKLNGAQLDSREIPYSQSYDSGDTVEFKFQNFIPGFAPPGSYTLICNFINDAGTAEGCFSFGFKL